MIFQCDFSNIKLAGALPYVTIILKFLQRTRCFVPCYNCSSGKCVFKLSDCARTTKTNRNIFKTNARERGTGHPRALSRRARGAMTFAIPHVRRLRGEKARAKKGWPPSYTNYEVDTQPPVLKDKNCVAAKRYMRELARVRTPLCYFRAANRAASSEALNRTGSPDEEGSSHDTVPTCWSIAPFLTWVNNKRGNVKFTTGRTRDQRYRMSRTVLRFETSEW